MPSEHYAPRHFAPENETDIAPSGDGEGHTARAKRGIGMRAVSILASSRSVGDEMSYDQPSSLSLLSFNNFKRVRRLTSKANRERLVDSLREKGIPDDFIELYTDSGLEVIDHSIGDRRISGGAVVKSATPRSR